MHIFDDICFANNDVADLITEIAEHTWNYTTYSGSSQVKSIDFDELSLITDTDPFGGLL